MQITLECTEVATRTIKGVLLNQTKYEYIFTCTSAGNISILRVESAEPLPECIVGSTGEATIYPPV